MSEKFLLLQISVILSKFVKTVSFPCLSYMTTIFCTILIVFVTFSCKMCVIWVGTCARMLHRKQGFGHSLNKICLANVFIVLMFMLKYRYLHTLLKFTFFFAVSTIERGRGAVLCVGMLLFICFSLT